MSEKIVRYIIILSAIHVGLCYIYIYLFQFGFSANLSGLFSVNDIISIGLSKLLPFYVIQLLSIGNFLATYEKNPFSSDFHDRFEFRDDLPAGCTSRNMLILSVILLLANAAISAIYKSFSFTLCLPIILYASWKTAIRFSEDEKISQRLGIYGLILGLCVSAFFWRAYSDGFESRVRSYTELNSRDMSLIRGIYPQCPDKSLIILPVNDKFIVVKPNGDRAFYSEDCKLSLIIPKIDIIIDTKW